MSCKCQHCGQRFKMDLLIANKIWEQIKPQHKSKGAGLLCPSCIVQKIEKLFGYSAFKIRQIK